MYPFMSSTSCGLILYILASTISQKKKSVCIQSGDCGDRKKLFRYVMQGPKGIEGIAPTHS
jgi:hypothetical protein